jgi:hypothetical protein
MSALVFILGKALGFKALLKPELTGALIIPIRPATLSFYPTQKKLLKVVKENPPSREALNGPLIMYKGWVLLQ